VPPNLDVPFSVVVKTPLDLAEGLSLTW
jgi:hypothetical protein